MYTGVALVSMIDGGWEPVAPGQTLAVLIADNARACREAAAVIGQPDRQNATH